MAYKGVTRYWPLNSWYLHLVSIHTHTLPLNVEMWRSSRVTNSINLCLFINVRTSYPHPFFPFLAISLHSILRGRAMVLKSIEIVKARFPPSPNFLPLPNPHSCLLRNEILNVGRIKLSLFYNPYLKGQMKISLVVDLHFTNKVKYLRCSS